MPLSELTQPPLTRVQIARYAGAVRDFNPIHVDEEFAKRSGMPSAIAHGPLTISLALDAIVSQVGAGAVRAFEARLKAPFTPGDQLTVVPLEDGAVEVRNGSGAIVATATLTLATD